MNNQEKTEIKKMLKNRPDLICEQLYLRSFQEVKGILGMPEWKEEKFQGLLTSNIWSSNEREVKEKIDLDYWKQDKYKHLLKPTIFSISIKNIKEGIQLLEEYNISEYITFNCLRKNMKQQKRLLEYMIYNDIDLIVDDNKKEGQKKLNPILNASNTVLKTKYKIDINAIMKMSDTVKLNNGEGR